MAVLGISSSTWLKLKKGEAVRSSVVDRLLDRFGDPSSAAVAVRLDH